MKSRTSDAGIVTLIDGHVHIHDCFETAAFFDAACRNFRNVARGKDDGADPVGVLLLTETAQADEFSALRGRAVAHDGGESLGGWSVLPTGEPESLRLRRTDGREMIVIAGRQIVTQERLEVLALATDRRYPDGEPIGTMLARVVADGAIAVVPWGFGKWLGQRGRIVRNLLIDYPDLPFFLGDNSGRLRYAPQPAEFGQAISAGRPVLPGSDPLPFESETDRAGRYGFALRAELSRETPASDLRNILLAPEPPELVPYGRGEGFFRFVRNQVAMQLKMRRQVPADAGRESV